MLIHKNVFNKVGFMDSKYFMYYDDTDFCLRANRCGYKILFVPEAVMWHKVHSSSGGSEYSRTSVYYLSRNRLYLMKKNKDKLGKHAYQTAAKILWDSIAHYNKARFSKYVWIGYIDYFRGHLYRKDFR
jgi:GT2 family glycosyltransferase